MALHIKKRLKCHENYVILMCIFLISIHKGKASTLLGVKIRVFKVKESIYVGSKLIHILKIQDG